jgi:eukaryotic-like serine/threonine-protein kinase
MTVPIMLFKHVARAYLNHIGGGILGEIAVGLAEDVFDGWRTERDERSRKLEVEAIAQATSEQVKQAVREAVELVASERAEADREAVAVYLMHVPGAIRQTLRRASDPSGRTLPSAFAMKDAKDLAAILPDRLPRFRPGDKPWPNVDRELVELLGVGGFGEVWKAVNPSRPGVGPVALKFCIDLAAKDRLLRHEASLLDRIMEVGSRPGIVRLNDTYLSADPPCLEYEYVAGGELTGLMRDYRSRGGIAPRDAAKIVERLARTVGFFHRLDPPIVHRDLKPANILVKAEGSGSIRLKVADFGIGGIAAGREIERSLTRASGSGQACSISRGSYTPLYASPEQIRGAPPDPRDDVHALGVIWFQLLTGDSSVGAPTGMDWVEDLEGRGMTLDQIRVLGSCFSSNPGRRPVDAGSLAEKVASAFLLAEDGRAAVSGGNGGEGGDAPPKGPPPAIRIEPGPEPLATRILHIKSKVAHASGSEVGRRFVVRAGSEARLATVDSVDPSLIDLREELKGRGILVEEEGKLVFREDYRFDSPSSAAGVILGRNTNGRTAWKDGSGKTLKEIQEGAG